MGFFGLFGKRDKRFVSDRAFGGNLTRQVGMCSQTLDALRQHGVTNETQLRLEFFFYTNTPQKASALAASLRGRGYSVEHGPSTGGDRKFVVTGWTSKMRMDDATVAGWCETMCRLGFQHDCDFDGWGTDPEQE
jgi:hypothetical protein